MKIFTPTFALRITARLIAGALSTLALPYVAFAGPAPLSVSPSELVTPDIIASVQEWATAPVVLQALNGRNTGTGVLDQAEIDRLDKQWRAERKIEDQPLITSVLANPLSSYLIRIQAGSVGLYTEVFVMDRNGLNTGQSSVTSDYWQGDEGKFQKTFGAAADAVFLDEVELHEGTATWRAQLNMTLADAEGQSAGAITVELNLTELERRYMLASNRNLMREQ